MEWHAKGIEEVLKLLKTSEKGLSEREAEERLKKYGPNLIEKKRKLESLKILVRQFTSFLVLLIVFAACVSFLIGELFDGLAISAIIILNVSLGFFQEYRAEKAVEALKKLAAPKAKVLRDGKLRILDAKNLVPGDIIFFEQGDILPADVRIIEAVNLKIDESILTGESIPSLKFTQKLLEKTTLADRENMGYSSTLVTYGRGKGVVVATGMKTEFGKIAESIQKIKEEPTPLLLRLRNLGLWLGAIILLLCGIIFAVELIFTRKIYESFMIAVALAVSAVPEGLPVAVTVCLALGVRRMAKRNAIVKKLASVETLGCVTVIATDKTGTLTKNEMTVKKIFVDNKVLEVTGIGYEPVGKILENGKEVKKLKDLSLLFEIGCLCNRASLEKDGEWRVVGDPTEGSLLVAAAKFGIWKEKLEKEYPIAAEIPFSSERKMMTTVHKRGKKYFVCVKGAPEVIVHKSKFILKNSKIRRFSKEEKERILEKVKEFGKEALRTLAFAYKEIKSIKKVDEKIEEELIFVGFVGMIDPPRPEVKEAVEKCRQAGIKVLMITGDHALTAKAIAKEVGMESEHVITGAELDELSGKELEEVVEKVTIYARTSAQHKERILEALRKKGHVIAMTGDGVNDAPAVKKADVGIAMGKKGSDVTREASHIVLADDNFATIVNAIEEGRGIYDNIRKFIRYLLSVNFAEIFLILATTLLRLPLPLLPLQILWINLLTDGLPALALSTDPYEKDIMKRRPRSKKEGIFHKMLLFIIVGGIVNFIFDFLIFIFGLREFNIYKARTMVFTFVVVFELFFIFNCRSEKHSVFRTGIGGNKKLLLAVSISFLLQLLVIYIPFFQAIFKTVPLSLRDWMIILLFSSSALFVLPEIFMR
jgi:Ca2+-transporting ATPase